MKPIGILMWEHRLIERVIGLFPEHVARIGRTGTVDTFFIENAVDFIRTYADRTHHGKEEDILFRQLEGKNMSPEHRKIMVDRSHQRTHSCQGPGEEARGCKRSIHQRGGYGQ